MTLTSTPSRCIRLASRTSRHYGRSYCAAATAPMASSQFAFESRVVQWHSIEVHFIDSYSYTTVPAPHTDRYEWI